MDDRCLLLLLLLSRANVNQWRHGEGYWNVDGENVRRLWLVQQRLLVRTGVAWDRVGVVVGRGVGVLVDVPVDVVEGSQVCPRSPHYLRHAILT